MLGFVDRQLVLLRQEVKLREMLAPTGDDNARLRTLLDAAFTMPSGTIHDVVEFNVVGIEVQCQIFRPRLIHGTWTRTTPDHSRTDVLYEEPHAGEPLWVDLAATVDVTVALEHDAGEVEAVTANAAAPFETLEEFQAQFPEFDLDGFMARKGLSTVEDLREAYKYLFAEVSLKPSSGLRHYLNTVMRP